MAEDPTAPFTHFILVFMLPLFEGTKPKQEDASLSSSHRGTNSVKERVNDEDEVWQSWMLIKKHSARLFSERCAGVVSRCPDFRGFKTLTDTTSLLFVWTFLWMWTGAMLLSMSLWWRPRRKHPYHCPPLQEHSDCVMWAEIKSDQGLISMLWYSDQSVGHCSCVNCSNVST